MLPTIALRGKERELHPPWSRKGLKPRLQADCDGSKMDSIKCGTQAPNSCLPTKPMCSWKHAEERPPSEEGEMMVRLRLLTLGKGQLLALHAGWGTVVAVAFGFFQSQSSLRMQISMESWKKMPALGQRKEFSKSEEPGGRWWRASCHKLCYFSPCSSVTPTTSSLEEDMLLTFLSFTSP